MNSATSKELGQIFEGHANKVLNSIGLLSDDTKMLGQQRFDDCLTCDTRPHPGNKNITGPGLRDGRYCKQCTCDMTAKTLVIGATCPIGRW